MNKIAIVGGGIAGLSAAIALRGVDARVEIFESAPTFQPVGAGLVLAANAVQALRVLGIREEVLAAGHEIRELCILDRSGQAITCTDHLKTHSRLGTISNFSIHRADLHRILLSRIDHAGMHLGKNCLGFHDAADQIMLRFDDHTEVQADYVIAADGIHSPIRQQLLPEAAPRYAGYTCWRGILDRWPGFREPHRATETWGAGRRFGIVPLANEKLYWFATLNADRPGDPHYRDFQVADLEDVFAEFHEPVPGVLARTRDEDLLWNDILDIEPIPRFHFDRILLIGDAAHATTPNMGQGACQALEDSAVLNKCLSRAQSIGEAFQAFEAERLARTAWIIRTSRRIGRIAQWENSWLRHFRDGLVRLLPPAVNRSQMEKILEVDF